MFNYLLIPTDVPATYKDTFTKATHHDYQEAFKLGSQIPNEQLKKNHFIQTTKLSVKLLEKSLLMKQASQEMAQQGLSSMIIQLSPRHMLQVMMTETRKRNNFISFQLNLINIHR